MIRTLRVRFFLLVWPLVVVALVLLGILLGRWSTVEIRRVSAELQTEQERSSALERVADSLATIPHGDLEALQAAIGRIAARDSAFRGAVVVTPGRGLVATGIEGLGPEDVTVGPDHRIDVNRSERSGHAEARLRVIAVGRPLDPPSQADPRLLVVLPPLTGAVALQDSLAIPSLSSSTLTRRIVIALVVGSVIAALVTLVLSGQLTGRVEKLAHAVGSLGRGDLSARVAVEGRDEIAELATRFNAMAVGLEASERQRRQMVSDVAHELRTPLTNLIGMVEAARDGLRPADRELLDTLAEEAGFLNALVDDLRDLALADAGELRLAREPFDARRLAERIGASFAGNPHGVRVAVSGADQAPVLGDERRLGQVLRNLVQNAVTHSPDGGVVEVRVTGDGGRVTVAVTDQGLGIPPEHLPRIWDRFYRVDPSRARATGGMGLGLPVARRLVEAMGGEVTVESVVGTGTTFTVRLVTA